MRLLFHSLLERFIREGLREAGGRLKLGVLGQGTGKMLDVA